MLRLRWKHFLPKCQNLRQKQCRPGVQPSSLPASQRLLWHMRPTAPRCQVTAHKPTVSDMRVCTGHAGPQSSAAMAS